MGFIEIRNTFTIEISQHLFVCLILPHYWRQLEQITHEYDLFSAKRQIASHHLAETSVHPVHHVASHHRSLIHNNCVYHLRQVALLFRESHHGTWTNY